MYKILSFTDTHHPWASNYKLNKMYQLIKAEKPDIIICLGDDYDLFTFGGYPRNQSIITPEQELNKGRKANEKMWHFIHRAAPDAKLMRLGGNHNCRIAKQVIRAYPQVISFIDDSYLYEFKHVETVGGERDFIKLDNTIYCHGWSANSVGHRNHFNNSVVHGHSHRAEIRLDYNHKTAHKPFYAVSAGCMIDLNAPVFDYTASKHTNWKHAVCIVENDFPKLILL